MSQITPKAPDKVVTYPCPECKAPVAWAEAKFKPFCSERCKTLDFGAWANETHVISGSVQNESYDEF